MPKPMFGDNGSGMHVHMSLWKDGTNLFFDPKGYALLSDAARWYIGGVIKHAPAPLGVAGPTTNKYPRPGAGDGGARKPIFSPRHPPAGRPPPRVSQAPQAGRGGGSWP